MPRLTESDLARMRTEHVPVDGGRDDGREICNSYACWSCEEDDYFYGTAWPCDAARLLAHFAPGPVPHLAGIVDARS